MGKCYSNKTELQPTDEEWKCPGCGSGIGVFYISYSSCNPDCNNLHKEDLLGCDNCDGEYTGKEFIELMNIKYKPCKHCNGTGKIRGKDGI